MTDPVADALVRSLHTADLQRAFRVAGAALRLEIAEAEPGLARRLAQPLRELADLR